MNSLSWLIYLADIIPNVGTICVLLGLLFLILSGAAFFAYTDKTISFKTFISLLITAIVLLVIATLVPERTTIMMIAASEFGEEIATSAEAKNIGGKAYKSLDKFLSEYLEDERDGL
jgi:Ca2+/Na+ antiporter